MFPVFRSLSLRYLRLRWDRSALVVASIALGVATMVSTRLLNQCLEAAAHDTMTPIPTADLYVTNGELGVMLAVADDLKQAKFGGVENVVPMIFEQIRLPETGGPNGQLAILVAADTADLAGVKEDGKKAFTPHIIDFQLARTASGIFISQFLYNERKAQGISDKAGVKMRFAEREIEFPLAGVLEVDQDGKAASFERNLVAMDLKLAFRLLRNPSPASAAFVAGGIVPALDAIKRDRVSRIDIHLAPGADRGQTGDAVKKVVGDRAEVKTLEQQKESTDDAISGIQISLKLCSAGALIVGLFLVYNALSVSVAERRHDIGVLRSIGATRFQIARLFAGEAALLGLAGAALGIPLGKYLADMAVGVVSDDLNAMFLNPDVRPTQLSLATIVTAVVAGVLTALLAALAPAVQAANDEPADAVRRAPVVANRFFFYVHRFTCLLLIVIGIGMVVFRSYLPERTGSYLGLSFIMVGQFMSMPILLGWLARSLQPLSRHLLGIEARLAADNLVRAPARTGVVIGALAAGVSLMFQTAGVGRSNEDPIKKWVDQVIQADAFVFSGSLASANSSMTPMRPDVGEAIRKVDGVERVVALHFLHPDYKGSIVCLVAIDADDYLHGTRSRLPQGHGLSGLETFANLSAGNNIVVSDNFAAKFGMKLGDVVTLPRRHGGPIDLTIVGIGQDYTWSKGTLFMDRKRYVEAFDDDFVDVYHAYYKPEADSAVTRKAVEDAVAPWKLGVEDKGFVREFLAGVIDKLYRLAYMQQIIVAIVAALGVVTALLISVLQRRRELGLLRAVGATQPQVLKTVLAEAFLMGVIGTVLGVAIGLPMEWYLLRVVLFEESGFWFEMIIPWKEALGIATVAVCVATIAGLIPALHAMRLRITDAIAYE
jgi:putative ABC transport system permease protein